MFSFFFFILIDFVFLTCFNIFLGLKKTHSEQCQPSFTPSSLLSANHLCLGNQFHCLLVYSSCISFWKKKSDLSISPFFSFLKFICLFWESMSTGGAEREWERENPKLAPHCHCRAWRGVWTHELWDRGLRWSQESDTQMSEPPWHPSPFFLH